MSQLQPVPHKSEMVDSVGLPSRSWADWFQKIYSYLGPEAWVKAQSASGYQKLPSGLYIQWGVTASLSSGTTTTISLPKTFPNSCLQVILGIKDIPSGSTAATGHYGTGNYTADGFDLYNRTSAGYVFNWLAVGY